MAVGLEVGKTPGDGEADPLLLARRQGYPLSNGAHERLSKRRLRFARLGQIGAVEQYLGGRSVGKRGAGQGPILAGQHGQTHGAEVGLRFQRPAIRRSGTVRQFNLIDVDVPPSAGSPVDDFDPRLLAFQVPHVPVMPVEMLAVLSNRGPHGLSVNQQIDAGLAGRLASAD